MCSRLLFSRSPFHILLSNIPLNFVMHFSFFVSKFFYLAITVQPDNLAAGQDMSTDILKEKIKTALDELAEKQETFIIVIDAINQVI